MGSCLSRSSAAKGPGQRLGSSVEGGEGGVTVNQQQPSSSTREERLAAVEARMQKQKQRGMGDGQLSKKLDEENKQGGTGKRVVQY